MKFCFLNSYCPPSCIKFNNFCCMFAMDFIVSAGLKWIYYTDSSVGIATIKIYEYHTLEICF